MGESPINLGRLIKNARLEAGLTQDNLATQVGVTPRYIMAIENETGRNHHFGIFAVLSQNSVFSPELQLFSSPNN